MRTSFTSPVGMEGERRDDFKYHALGELLRNSSPCLIESFPAGDDPAKILGPRNPLACVLVAQSGLGAQCIRRSDVRIGRLRHLGPPFLISTVSAISCGGRLRLN